MPAPAPVLIGMHVANIAIALAYLVIGWRFGLAFYRGRHLSIPPEVSLNLATYILLCAGTHFGMFGAMYAGWLLLALGIKVITALFSIHTAWWFWKAPIGA